MLLRGDFPMNYIRLVAVSLLLLLSCTMPLKAEPLHRFSLGDDTARSSRQLLQGASLNATVNTTGVNATGVNTTSVNGSNPVAPPGIAPSPATVLVPEPQSSCGIGGPCRNGGQPTLIEVNGNVSCVCNCTAVGFDGDHCEIPRQVCSPDGFYCANGGVCGVPSTPGGAYICHCPVGVYGSQCTEKGQICTASLICKNGATCNATAAGLPECICPAGFGGTDCGSRVTTPSSSGPASFFEGKGGKTNPVGVAFGIIGGLVVAGLLAVGGVFCWRRYQKRKSPYSFDYLYNQQSAPMTGGAFSEVQMEDLHSEQDYRNGSNIHNTSLNY